MPAKRTLSAALALLLVAASPVRATTPPTITVIDTIYPDLESSYAMDTSISAAFDGYLYFAAVDSAHGEELWRTNGTSTTLIKDINTGLGGADADGFTPLGDYLYFSAYDGTHGTELWRTDGTEAGTTLVKDINTNDDGADSSYPYAFTALGGYLYFQANDGAHGYELWRTNGTEAGTTLVKDINTNSGGDESSAPDHFEVFGGYLYFQANDGTNGYELWRTNGTEAGTTLFQDINTASSGENSSYPYDFTALGGYLYFTANDGAHGYELWRTNGTSPAALVKDINSTSGGAASSYASNFTALGDYIYLRADDGIHGWELWRTNGTEAGTTLVEDINANGADGSSPRNITRFGDYLYFRANEGTHGNELWRTNGTSPAALVEDINTTGGGAGSFPERLIVLGDYLYFRANDGSNGDEIWRTDGATTEKVPFPTAGQYISCDCYDTDIVAVGGRLYTTVYSDDIGNEFAYLDEPTYVLPSTNRDSSVWTMTLVILAGITAAASITVRHRGAVRA